MAFGDLGDADTPKQLIDAAVANFGRIDILVNNAAVTDAATLARDLNVADMDGAIWQRVLNINLVAPALLSKYAIPHMIAYGGGSIVMISSGRGVQGDFGLPAYGASKAAIINLAANIATQYGKQGIRANTVVVGMVSTPASRATLDPSMVELYTSHHLTPYIGETEDIAAPVCFLASEEARFITGTVVTVDGGMTAHCAPYSDILKMSASSMLKQD
jgi:NAD(P)-dependent dehydrogenase (short-subunit alcohol dehydrogenase family)